ncbi:MAG: hypothetical protein RLZZ196_1259 [Bacteroidota bacterium]
MKRSNLTPNQLVLLKLLYHNDIESIVAIFGKSEALIIRNSLIGSNYILSGNTKFTDTILSKKNIEKLLDIRSDEINFWEFYNCYPIKVGPRVLRAAGPTSQIALKHEKKYLARVRTIEAHQQAVSAIQSFVAKQKQAGKLNFLPNMETVLNNSMWEQWFIFIQETGIEEQEWNNDQI